MKSKYTATGTQVSITHHFKRTFPMSLNEEKHAMMAATSHTPTIVATAMVTWLVHTHHCCYHHGDMIGYTPTIVATTMVAWLVTHPTLLLLPWWHDWSHTHHCCYCHGDMTSHTPAIVASTMVMWLVTYPSLLPLPWWYDWSHTHQSVLIKTPSIYKSNTQIIGDPKFSSQKSIK